MQSIPSYVLQRKHHDDLPYLADLTDLLTHTSPQQIKTPTTPVSVYNEFNWQLQEHTSWISIIAKVELWKLAGQSYCVG